MDSRAATQDNARTNGAGSAGVDAAAPAPSAFDRAKGMLDSDIERFGDNAIDFHSVMAKADAIAAEWKVRASDLRGWAKEKMETLRARPASVSAPAAPALSCATDPEPIPTPRPLDVLLRAIVTMVTGRVYCAPEAADACALWAAGTWGIYPPSDPGAGPDLFPRLHIHAPAKRCGKSTLLETVTQVASRPLGVSDVSEAAIFRTIAKYRPTLMIDEADRLFAKNKDLVGIINSGYVRTGHVVRTMEMQAREVRSFEPVGFPTFAAVALAGIGSVPPTIEDRSIRVELQRQPRDRMRQRIRLRQLAALRDKLAPHLMAHADAIGAAMAEGVPDGAIPPGLNDRDADNWRPLFGLAALAGGDWPTRVRQAAGALCKESADGDRGSEWALRQIVEFISDARRAAVSEWRAWVRGGRKTARALPGRPSLQRAVPYRFIVSDDLAAWLMNKDDSGFGDERDIGRVKLRVARMLRGFGIVPGRRRIGGAPLRGYEVATIRAVWRRYRP